MYRYRDRIQYQNYLPDRSGDPYTLHSIILYPGDQIHTESGHSIGALPLKPGLLLPRLNEIRAHLKKLLYDAYLID
jgi:hypothetical protein